MEYSLIICHLVQASNDNLSPHNVSKIWDADEEEPIMEEIDLNNKSRANDNDNSRRNPEKSRSKENRQNQFDSRRSSLNSHQNAAPPFLETKVTLEKNIAKKFQENDEFKKILKTEKVELNKGKLKGSWNVIFEIGQKILSLIPGWDLIPGSTDDQKSSDSSRSGVDQSDTSAPLSDQSVQSKEPDESFSVSSLFLRFMISHHYEQYQKLENVCREISFEDGELKTERNLKLFARKNVKRNVFSKTVDKFIDYYQEQNQKMRQEIIPVMAKDVISDVRTKFSVVIDAAVHTDKMIVYGEKDNVEEVMKFLKNKVDDLSTSASASSSSKTKGAGGSSSSRGADLPIEKLSCILFQRVKVSVYQGDITKEVVDVIVNPANEDLMHSAGAAAAIVKAGGKIIQDDSDEIRKQRRGKRLVPGEVVVTKAGNLPCNFIIHAVGPRWSNYNQKEEAKNVLNCAVINCLNVAIQHGARSISVPAISSGIFGVPVDLCAEVLFQVATNFAQNAPNFVTLKEIRFVNIDKPTSQVFAQEMKKMYGISVYQENMDVLHSSIVRENKIAHNSQLNAWKQNPLNNATNTGGPQTTNLSRSSDDNGKGKVF